MSELLKKYEGLNLEVFIVVNKAQWDKYKAIMKNFPFNTVFYDPATTEGQDFTYELIQLNEKHMEQEWLRQIGHLQILELLEQA